MNLDIYGWLIAAIVALVGLLGWQSRNHEKIKHEEKRRELDAVREKKDLDNEIQGYSDDHLLNEFERMRAIREKKRR